MDTVTDQDLRLDELLPIKPGVHLLKTDEQWKLENQYFQSVLSDFPLNPDSMDTAITYMNTSIYNYLKDTFGIVEQNINTDLVEKYENHSAKDLKKDLKSLKISCAPVGEIQYISRLLHKKFTVIQPTVISFDKSDHDQSLSGIFWGYVKRVLQNKPSQLPTFSLEL